MRASSVFSAPAEGTPARAAGLAGRARTYLVRMPDGARRDAAGFALSSGCDLLVAAAIGRDAADRDRVVTLLESGPVAGWLNAKLGRARTAFATR